MHRFATYCFSLVVVAALLFAATVTHAASVSVEKNPSYGRLNFTFATPARMKVKSAGNLITLNFSAPVGATASAIKKQLGGYVSAVTASSDGKTVIFTLKSPARIRQFANGKTLGIDMVGSAPEGESPAADAHRDSTKAPFQKAEKLKPVAGPVAKSVPVPAVEQHDAAAPSAPTKAAKPRPHGTKELAITVRNSKEGAILNFPWPSRVAASVFERPRTIWVIFSHEADAHADNLASLMPKQVVRVQQYAYPGALVLRLTTDGTLHATTSQSGSNYDWNVTLSNTPPSKPTLDTPINPDISGDQRRLLFGVFDVSEALQFYDPATNDRILTIPTFETGRGVDAPRDYPDFSVMSTQQGITILSPRTDLVTEATRQGVQLSAAHPLAISEALPMVTANAAPVPNASAAVNIMLPYDQWYVPPKDFKDERQKRIQEIASANADGAADAMMRMVSLYLAQGFAQEASAYLQIIQRLYPDYYHQKKLALLMAVCQVHMNQLPEAARTIAAPELNGFEEATLWRELIAFVMPSVTSFLDQVDSAVAANSPPAAASNAPPAPASAPTAPATAAVTPQQAPLFDWKKYHKPYLHFYPPRIRQHMALLLNEAYLQQGQDKEALALLDTLVNDGILEPIRAESELLLGGIAEKANKPKEAQGIYDRLSADNARLHTQVAAQFAGAMLRYRTGKLDAASATQVLEGLRLMWHGDRLERDILYQLSQIYADQKQYADSLRSLKMLLDSFPNDPEYLKLSGDMNELFENLFLHGKADELPPLKSLALFYEFRDLTPIGDKGDAMIQNLAGRLAGVDLLDRAIQLLDNQIKFRTSGENRSKVGARLALLYLLNRQPAEALRTIETTNFATANPDLLKQRTELSAKALAALGKPDEALSLLVTNKSRDANLLRLEILWNAKDWPNVINQAEDILTARPNLTAPLDPQETEVLMKLVLGYNFEGDKTQLKYLRDYYSGLLGESSYKQIFDYLTNDTSPLDAEDFALIAKQISHTESFLDSFKQKISQGALSR